MSFHQSGGRTPPPRAAAVRPQAGTEGRYAGWLTTRSAEGLVVANDVAGRLELHTEAVAVDAAHVGEVRAGFTGVDLELVTGAQLAVEVVVHEDYSLALTRVVAVDFRDQTIAGGVSRGVQQEPVHRVD